MLVVGLHVMLLLHSSRRQRFISLHLPQNWSALATGLECFIHQLLIHNAHLADQLLVMLAVAPAVPAAQVQVARGERRISDIPDPLASLSTFAGTIAPASLNGCGMRMPACP